MKGCGKHPVQPQRRNRHPQLSQALLRARGIECPAAGVFDAQTRTAVLTFQARRGLDRDGIAGGMTWGALLDRARP